VRRRAGRRRPTVCLLAVLSLATAGCSMAIPSWVPLLGSAPKAPTAAEAPKPLPPASAPILTSRDQIESSPDVVDRVICVVNNDAITQYELDEAELYYLAETREQMTDGEARKSLRARLLQTLIENRIQLQQAERDKVVIEDAELADNVADIMKKLKAKDDKEFEEIIKSQGLTIEGVRKRLREQLMVQRVIRRKVALRISVTEQEIDKYLVDNREKLETGLTFAPRHILVVPDPNKGEEGWLEARKRSCWRDRTSASWPRSSPRTRPARTEAASATSSAGSWRPRSRKRSCACSPARSPLPSAPRWATTSSSSTRARRSAATPWSRCVARSATSSTARSTTRDSRIGWSRSSSGRSSMFGCSGRT